MVKPSWFKDIKDEAKFSIKEFFGNKHFIYFNNSPKNNSPNNIAVFRDGPFFPPSTGMASHLFNLCHNISKCKENVTLVKCFRGFDDPNNYKNFNFNVLFVNPKHYYNNLSKLLNKLAELEAKTLVFDSSEAIEIQAQCFYNNDFKIIHDLTNTDFILKKDQDSDYRKDHLLSTSKFTNIFMCKTKKDMENILAIGIPKSKCLVIPPIFDFSGIDSKKRCRNFEQSKIVFLGNLEYQFNKNALNFLNSISKKNDEFTIVAIGDHNKNLPYNFKNIKFLGKIINIKEELKKYDLALNPVQEGTGISIKIADYIINNLPIITTETGIRGYNSKIKRYTIVEELKNFDREINNLLNKENKRKYLSKKAKEALIEHYNPSHLTRKYLSSIFQA